MSPPGRRGAGEPHRRKAHMRERQEQIRVLLIEDSPLQARLVRELLSEAAEARFECEWADRLSKGIERLERGGIDVVLLDLTLPDSWGVETYTALRARAPAVPVVVLTSGYDRSLLEEARRSGAREHLLKDALDAGALEECLRRVAETGGADG